MKQHSSCHEMKYLSHSKSNRNKYESLSLTGISHLETAQELPRLVLSTFDVERHHATETSHLPLSQVVLWV